LRSFGAPWVARLGQGVRGELGVEVEQLAGLLRRVQDAVADERDSSGVVAPVLQPPQAPHDDIESGALTDISDNSAHGVKSSGVGGGDTKPAVLRASRGAACSDWTPHP
jgi:hypothetical protein